MSRPPNLLAEAVARFEKMSFDPALIQQHAEIFSRQRCKEAFRALFIEYQGEMS